MPLCKLLRHHCGGHATGVDATIRANVETVTGHALRRNAGGAFGPDLAKKLAQLVKMEKNVMRSLETVAKERMDVAVSCSSGTSQRSRSANVDAATNLHLG